MTGRVGLQLCPPLLGIGLKKSLDQKWATGYPIRTMTANNPKPENNVYDTVIIGGGPAGLTAGIYNSRARTKTILLQSTVLVPQIAITDSIENYPGYPEPINGFTLTDNMRKQAINFGLQIQSGQVTALVNIDYKETPGWQVTTEDNSFNSLAVIIASGARLRELGVPGEKKFQGRGVSYCATCDGALFRNKEIIVAGGGDTAIEEALFLTRFASKVTIIHRRDRLRATKILQERARANKKIAFALGSVVTAIKGTNTVAAVNIRDVKTSQEKDLPCQGVFIFIGYLPNTDFARGIVDLDDKGYIKAGPEMTTSAQGIFAAGDCRQKRLRQVVTAAGDGATAAWAAQQYVDELKGIAYK